MLSLPNCLPVRQANNQLVCLPDKGLLASQLAKQTLRFWDEEATNKQTEPRRANKQIILLARKTMFVPSADQQTNYLLAWQADKQLARQTVNTCVGPPREHLLFAQQANNLSHVGLTN
jgi:hypothetical protein